MVINYCRGAVLVLLILVAGSRVALAANTSECEAMLTEGRPLAPAAAVVKDAAKVAADELAAEVKTAADENGGKLDETAVKRTVGRRIKDTLTKAVDNLKGGCLRTNSVAMKNFAKTLTTVWSFQTVGFFLATHGRSKEQQLENPVDFPFAVLANTAFLIWIQSELNCRNTAAPAAGAAAAAPRSLKDLGHEYVYGTDQTFHDATKTYFANVKSRYSGYMVTLPIGIVSFTIIQAIEDEIRKKIEGPASKRPDFLSKDHMQSVLSDAIFNTAFNSVWLFPRWAFATTPFEMRFIPMFRAFARTKGVAVGISAAAGEWAYRISMGLLDNWVFFKTRRDGIEIKGFASFNPNKLAGEIIDKLTVHEVQDPAGTRRLIEERQQRP